MIEIPIQIRFSDIDALHHVNNACIQHYYDQGKNAYMQEVLGMKHIWEGYGFIQANTNTNFLIPIYIEDHISVRTRVTRIGTKSVTFYQEIVSADTSNVLSNCTSVLVGFDIPNKKSIVLLPEWTQAIRKHESF